ELVLLSGTILDNVAYGKPSATELEVMEALRLAEAWPFVAALPNGLHAQLGEEGLKLSGGQKQRLALARALIRDPRILILDEATSAIDVTLEDKLQGTLRQLMQGRTCFIVSHRSPSIVTCQNILVMDEGRVIAAGTHEKLLKSSTFYAQFSGNRV
ncbi:MAG: ATP-binding cassette domain-containing protein, partial [Proteobacteria bacterium]|nr:ATP-binding cassette domain-containing protein [Pseudomonadota bacterium]